MFEDWVAWLILAGAIVLYSITTLTLRVIEPRGLTAKLGITPHENSNEENRVSPAQYRATRMVLTTLRTGSLIAIVMSALEGARTAFETDSIALIMTAVAVSILLGVVILRTILNRLADGCYEDVEIWLSPITWTATLIGRIFRLRRVAEYIYETETQPSESHEELGGNVLSVLQGIASKDLRGSDLMMPLSEVVAVQKDTALGEIADMMTNLQLHNVLIYGDTIDDIKGTIEKADLLQTIRQDAKTSIDTEAIVKQIFFAPMSQQAVHLFDSFKGRDQMTAVMLDEDGLIAGILTYDLMIRHLLDVNGDPSSHSTATNNA